MIYKKHQSATNTHSLQSEEEEEEEEVIQDVVPHILLTSEKCQRSAASCLPTTTQTPADCSCKTACSQAANVPPTG